MSYQIELNQQRYKPQQATSLHLISGFTLVGVGALTLLLAKADWIQSLFHASLVPANLLGGISLLYGGLVLFIVFARSKWLLESSNNKRFRLLSAAIAAILCLVFFLSKWWLASGISGILAFANLFALLYEKKLNIALFVLIDEQSIELPATARRKQLAWTEVDRVILRHGIITIDCVNNVLYQWNIKHNDIDATLFEAYCREQIEKNIHKRTTEDW